MRTLFAISLVGGAFGGAILLATPPSFFARLVPWLVLFATALFAWGSFVRRQPAPGEGRLPPSGAGESRNSSSPSTAAISAAASACLMMAALTMAGLAVRAAGATKNVLAGVMNASAVALFVFSPDVHWLQVAFTAAGASLGGWVGALALQRVNERALQRRRGGDRRRADDRAVREGAVGGWTLAAGAAPRASHFRRDSAISRRWERSGRIHRKEACRGDANSSVLRSRAADVSLAHGGVDPLAIPLGLAAGGCRREHAARAPIADACTSRSA